MKDIIKNLELIGDKDTIVELKIEDSFLTVLINNLGKGGFISNKIGTKIPNGVYTVALEQLTRFAKNNDHVELTSCNNELQLVNGTRKFTLSPTKEKVPPLPKFFDIDFKVLLKEGIRKDITSLSKITTDENVNKSYGGILFDEKNMVSTDIHRILLIEDKIETRKPFIVNKECQKVLQKITPIDFNVTKDNRTVLTVSGGQFFFDNIKNEFPNFRAVYGERNRQDRINNISCRFNQKALIKELKIMVDMLKDKRKIVSCKYKNGVFYGYSDFNKYEFEFDLKIKQTFGFNAVYLKQALELCENALITTEATLRPIEVFNDKTRHLIMPRKV